MCMFTSLFLQSMNRNMNVRGNDPNVSLRPRNVVGLRVGTASRSIMAAP
jgi:hypothetical protein